MTIEQLRRAHQAKPFRPFTICLADGQKVKVPHPEFLLVPEGFNRTFVVATPPEAYQVIDLLLVTSLDFGNGTNRKRRRPA